MENKIYTRIKELRKEKKLSQDEIAKEFNMHRTQYVRYEKSESTVPLEFVEMLADYYNVSIDYIAGRTDKREINE